MTGFITKSGIFDVEKFMSVKNFYSCEAIIILTNAPNSPFSLTILLENRAGQSFISRNGQKLVTTTTPQILSAEEFRTFWISWKNGNIEVGYGQSPSLSSG